MDLLAIGELSEYVGLFDLKKKLVGDMHCGLNKNLEHANFRCWNTRVF